MEKKQRKKKERIKQCDTLPDGSILDLKNYDWGEFGNVLNKKEKAFIIWYTLPNQEAFEKSHIAGQKAGYSLLSSYRLNYRIQTEEKLKKTIDLFLNRFVKTSLSDAYHQAIQTKIKRAFYRFSDFYKDIEGSDDEVQSKIVAKPINQIDKDKIEIIDNVEYNNNGDAIYKLPSREKELNDIIKVYEKINQQDKNIGDYDVETTVDVVKENLATVKTTIKISNEKIRENAENYIENSEELPDYD